MGMTRKLHPDHQQFMSLVFRYSRMLESKAEKLAKKQSGRGRPSPEKDRLIRLERTLERWMVKAEEVYPQFPWEFSPSLKVPQPAVSKQTSKPMKSPPKPRRRKDGEDN